MGIIGAYSPGVTFSIGARGNGGIIGEASGIRTHKAGAYGGGTSSGCCSRGRASGGFSGWRRGFGESIDRWASGSCSVAKPASGGRACNDMSSSGSS